jgi:hypothetical protein
VSGISESTRNFHYDWLKRTIERLEERNQQGDKTVEMQTMELQHIFGELLSMHHRCDRLEDLLHQFAMYQHPSRMFVSSERLSAGTKE